MLILQLLLAHGVNLTLMLLLQCTHVVVMFARHVRQRVFVDFLEVPLLLEGVNLERMCNFETVPAVIT